MAIMYDVDTRHALDLDAKGSYGAALEALAEMLGCPPAQPLWCVGGELQTDGSLPPPPHSMMAAGKWVLVGDEGYDDLWCGPRLMARVTWHARAYWRADAKLLDGRVLYSRGANTDTSYDAWRSTPYR